jgi:orotidine-5'-phosphate decarboxylase
MPKMAQREAICMTGAINAAERIIVALDYPDAGEAKAMLRSLAGIPCYMKVGMQLFYAAGPQFILELKEQGYKVFLDLKMHDIPNTVKGGAASITRLGVDMFNVHAAGGLQMMQAAMEGVAEALAAEPGAGIGNGGKAPMVIAVTHLTSTSREVLNTEIGIHGSVEEAVIRYAELAHEAGLQGVVASPMEVEAVKKRLGYRFITVTPGIRPAGAAVNDQSRIMTPRQALDQGTDYMVIGRPITAAANPRAALEQIIADL